MMNSTRDSKSGALTLKWDVHSGGAVENESPNERWCWVHFESMFVERLMRYAFSSWFSSVCL